MVYRKCFKSFKEINYNFGIILKLTLMGKHQEDPAKLEM